MKVKVVFTGEDGKKRKLLLPLENLWMSRGNFSGMGQFKKLKILAVEE
jgi:hypothetical protein